MKEINKNEIKEILSNIGDYELLSIYNQYDEYNTIFQIEDFDVICENMTASEIAQKTFYGDFRPCDNYFTFDGYGNFKSNDFVEFLICLDDLVDYIVENKEDFDIIDLQEYFESLEETEEE